MYENSIREDALLVKSTSQVTRKSYIENRLTLELKGPYIMMGTRRMRGQMLCQVIELYAKVARGEECVHYDAVCQEWPRDFVN